MKGLNSVDETGRKIEDRERQDLSPRYWNFSKRSSKRGIFSIWILFSRINAFVFSDWESCRAAARISFVKRTLPLCVRNTRKVRIDR